MRVKLLDRQYYYYVTTSGEPSTPTLLVYTSTLLQADHGSMGPYSTYLFSFPFLGQPYHRVPWH